MTERSDLERWVAAGESQTQEFKLSSSKGSLRAACETISAFLNTDGGRVLFGVSDTGEIVGQDVSDATLREMSGEIQQHLDPPAVPSIDVIELDSRRAVVAVRVGRGSRRPYCYRAKAYARVGSSTVELTREQYNDMLVEQRHASSRWETEIAEGMSVNDLDGSLIVRTVEDAIRQGRLVDPLTREPLELLRGLGLVADDRLLRAAVVLFARADRILPYYVQCRVRLARFRGVDKSEFIDNRQVEGNAFELFLASNQFLYQHLPVAGRIVPNLFQRQDDPLYPPEALREALANAFCHRDYSNASGSIGVAIYDDRLELTSPGKLHFGLTVKDLYVPHESRPWNPAIASVFYKCGIIETWGRGTLKMAELTERAGLPRPEFEEMTDTLLVRFRPDRYVPPQRIGHNLTDRQQQVLASLAEVGPAGLETIRLAVGTEISTKSLQRDLQLLRTLELVETNGWGRGAKWSLRDGHGA